MKDCVEWDGYRQSAGYGSLFREGKQWLAHRWVWAQANGPIPPGMVLRHKCDNPPCVKLEHLELGTHQENSQDMVSRNRHDPHQSRKTHCPQGHEYTEENTYRPKSRPNERMCVECGRVRARERYRRLHPEAKLRKP